MGVGRYIYHHCLGTPAKGTTEGSIADALVQFLAFGFTFSICWGVRAGLGLHEVDVAPENELALRKSEYAFSVLYVCPRHEHVNRS